MKISNPDDLREAAVRLLTERNFRDIRIREAPNSADGGRDLEACTVGTDDAGMHYSYKWWIELKFVSKGNVKRKDIPDRIHDAAAYGADYYMLITNGTVSGPHQDLFREAAQRHRIRFALWDKYKLTELFSSLPSAASGSLQPGVDFRDREKETSYLSNLIRSRQLNVLYMRGTGGVGKSALCRHLLWRERKEFKTGQIDARLSNDLGFVLQALAGGFQRQGSSTSFVFSERLRLPEEERLRLLFEHLDSEPTLLLIDNFEELVSPDARLGPKWARRLLAHMLQNSQHKSMLLVTSRVQIADLELTGSARFFDYELEGWDIDFVRDHYLPSTDHLNTSLENLSDDVAERMQVLAILGGNPLALKIANQLCASYDFRHMVSLLPKQGDPAQALIKALSEQLGDDEVAALQRFAQFDRPLLADEIERYVCTSDVLINLEVRQLVEPLTTQREQFQLHPITSAHFALTDQPELRREIVLSVLDEIFDHIKQAKALIDETYFHFLLRQAVRMLSEVGEPDRAAELLVRIGTRVVSMGDIGYLQGLLDELRHLASPLLATRLLKAQGHIDDLKTDFAKGKQTYQDMLAQGIELGDSWSIAAALNGLGTMARHSGNAEKAIGLYTESLVRREADGDEVGQSNSHHNLGAVHLEHGDLDAAEHHLKLALKLRRKCKDSFRVSATQVYLAELHCHRADYPQARKELKSAIRIKQNFGDLVGALWARLLQAKIELLDPKGDVDFRASELAWCQEIADRVNKPRDKMLAAAFSAVHHILLGDRDPASGPLSKAWQLASQLNDQQEMLISEFAASVMRSKNLSDPQITEQARALLQRLKV